ncbi:MAG: protein kinase [Planctomycetes bacterium]|nr:protein kinase [Planctomycetota bacterium]
MADIRDNLFGTLAVRGHFVLPEQVDEALKLQKQYESNGQRVPRLGELLSHLGYMTPEQVRAVLQGQGPQAKGLFGEIGIRWQIFTKADIEAALSTQRELKGAGEAPMRIGQVLLTRGKIKAHQIRAILQAQGKQMVCCPNCNARYNMVKVSAGTRITCPRCRNQFVPVPSTDAYEPPQPELTPAPDTMPRVREEVRADITVELPAVKLPEETAAEDAAKKTVGPYQILQPLGSDYAGSLFKALHPQTGNVVVLRLFSPAIMQGQEDCDRWMMAGKAATELDHPNLQRILSMGTDGDRPYLVKEFIEGHSLRQQIERRGRFQQMEAVEILIQCGEALAYGHARDLIHGNLRPSHILIGMDRRVRVSELGTPKKIHQDLRLMASEAGTTSIPLYAPPEILIDEADADERTDIYNLAAIGYHLITGVAPQSGSDLLQAGFKAALQDVLPPSAIVTRVAPYLNRLLMKALQSEPADRYETMEAFIADLRKARAGLLAGVNEIPEIADEIQPGRRAAPPRPREKYQPRRQFKTYRTRGSKRTSGMRRATRSGLRKVAVEPEPLPAPPPPPAPLPVPVLGEDLFAQPMSPDEALRALQGLPDPEPDAPPAVPDFSGGRAPGGSRTLRQQMREEEELAERRRRRMGETEEKPKKELSDVAVACIVITAAGAFIFALVLLSADPKTGNIRPNDQYLETKNLEKKPALSPEEMEASKLKAREEDAQKELKTILKEFETRSLTLMFKVSRLTQFLNKYQDIAEKSEVMPGVVAMRDKFAADGVTKTKDEMLAYIKGEIEANRVNHAELQIDTWEKTWGSAATVSFTADLRKQIEAKRAEGAVPSQSIPPPPPKPLPPEAPPEPVVAAQPEGEGEAAAKTGEGEQAAKTDAPEKIEKSGEGEQAAKTDAPEAPEKAPAGDPVAALGWKAAAGTWSADGNELRGEAGGDVARIDRAYNKATELSVEFKGNCSAAGFAFGNHRFVLPPGNDWQTLKLHIGAGVPSLEIGGEIRPSLENVGEVQGTALGDTVSLIGITGRVYFRNFKAE